MTNTPFIFAKPNGKNFDFAPWGGIEGFLEASKLQGTGNGATLKRLVPDLAHAIDMTAVAVSGLPFDILDDNDKVFDSSADWKNELGGIPNPQKLLYLLASSLCGGSAYLLPTRTPKMIFELQYCAPQSITPYWDASGLKWFDRVTDNGAMSRIYPNGLIYFWLPDSDVEDAPAENHPLGNATLDAQIIYNMKNTMRMYGERGFVPITLLGAKGMPSEPERQKAEGFFDRLLRGGFNVLAKIINSDALTLIKVGAGMDELKQSYIELRKDAKESIADSFGIPAAMFMSDAAYASEMDVLMRQWYTDSRFVSIYQTIQETLNDQLLKPYHKRLRFNIQALEVFQEDEVARNTSLASFVTAVTTDAEVARLGMNFMGYDLSEEQKSDLDEIVRKKEENAKKVREQTNGTNPTNAPNDAEPQDTQPKEEPDEEPEEQTVKSFVLSAEEIKDIALWYDRAKTWHAKGKGTAVAWECKHLREEVAAPIRMKLAEAKSEADIVLAFQISETSTDKPQYRSETILLDTHTEAIKALAAVIERGIAEIRVETVTPAPVFNMTMPSISLTAQMPPNGTVNVSVPEQPAPVVNVTIPQQSAPVVNVTNEVNPTPVTVENQFSPQNDVTVQPADVTVVDGKKRRARVTRGPDGKISEITSDEV